MFEEGRRKRADRRRLTVSPSATPVAPPWPVSGLSTQVRLPRLPQWLLDVVHAQRVQSITVAGAASALLVTSAPTSRLTLLAQRTLAEHEWRAP